MPSIRTPTLEIDFDDQGPREAPVVLLLHGWPDDKSSWAAVAATLNAAGFRTIVPSLRGFGATRFLADDTPRTGNSTILAMDAIELMDALAVEVFCVAGHDWGASTAEAMAVGWPRRVRRLAMLGTPSRLGGLPTPSFEQARRFWYHWYMATQRGTEAVRADPKGFARAQWVDWSPPGWFDEETFERSARAFENPDWVAITLHSYRARWGEAGAEPDPRSLWLEDAVRTTKSLSVPGLYFQGLCDGVQPPAVSLSMPDRFDGPFERVELPGVGHFIQREAPAEVAARLLQHFA